jgi:hypothetical protein
MQVAGDVVVSKSEFARRRNVTPGRVSQWISEGKISGAALVGEGRYAQIREAVACQQLDRTLDVNQRYGNGLGTRLAVDARGPAGPASDGEACAGDGDRQGDLVSDVAPAAPERTASYSVQDQIARQRLEQIERQNREGARNEAVAAGLLTDANDVRQVVGRETAKLLSHFEGALATIASALAGQFKLPQRDVLHAMRGEYRKYRASESEALRDAAAALPATVAYELPDPAAAEPGAEDDE